MSIRLILSALFASVVVLSAQDTTLTRIYVGGGIATGYNQYSANFPKIGPMPVCCAEFTSGGGFHFGFSLHLGYEPAETLMGMQYSYGLRVSGMGLGGSLTDDEFIGFVISNGEVGQGLARHTVETSFSIVGAEPYLQLRPLADIPLTATIGMVMGFPVGTAYSQLEQLVEPTDPNITFETGSRTRGTVNAELPGLANPFFAAALGLGYRFEMDAQRSIEPRLEAVLGLQNITSAVSWGVNTYRLGVNVNFFLPKRIPPPPPPPPPAPIVPPRIPVLSSRLMIPEMLPAQTSGVVSIEVTREYLDAAPVMFFAKNSTVLLSGSQRATQLQQDVLSAITAYITQHPEAKLTVVGSCAVDEDPAVARERASYAMRLLHIPSEQLEMRIVRQGAVEYPELSEEHRSVQFLVDGSAQIFRVERTRDSSERLTTLRIPVGHIVSCDTACTSGVTASIDGRAIRLDGDGAMYTMIVDSAAIRSMQQGTPVIVRGQVAFEGTAASSEQQVVYTTFDPRVTVRSAPVGQTANGQSPLTLCYFEFNSSTIASFNEQAFAALKQAVASGKRVELIATTDHLGTDVSNADLASRRASAALDKLQAMGIGKNKVVIGTYQSKASENASPMDRIANRAVKIVIQD
ncbi:MAG: OmpA family protein [Ignavibacteria bacterium]